MKTKNNLLIKQLMEFGLSEKEAEAYLTLLELEIASVSELAKSANINRSSMYVVLSSLQKKGLVSVSEDKKVQKYIAISPEILLREAESNAKKTEEIKNRISIIIPELKALHKDTKQKPKIKVFEGKQGIINAFEDTLNNKEKIMRVSSSVKNISEFLPGYFPMYVKRRIELGIKMYGIHPHDKMARQIIKDILRFDKFDEPLFISPKKYKFPADMAIYDNKIAYMSLEKNGLAITIESKEIADVMKSVFDLAYEEAKNLTKN